MNEQLVKTNKRPLLRIAVGALIATLGGGLAFTALIAQTPSPSPMAREKCKFWPCTAGQSVESCEKLKGDVQAKFTTLMDDASKPDGKSKALREKITNPANGYKDAHTEVETRLGTLAPFGSDHLVAFYEPESVMSGSQIDPIHNAEYPNNRCLHIFYLPEVTANPKSEFKKQIACCYQPW